MTPLTSLTIESTTLSLLCTSLKVQTHPFLRHLCASMYSDMTEIHFKTRNCVVQVIGSWILTEMNWAVVSCGKLCWPVGFSMTAQRLTRLAECLNRRLIIGEAVYGHPFVSDNEGHNRHQKSICGESGSYGWTRCCQRKALSCKAVWWKLAYVMFLFLSIDSVL